MNEEIAKTGSKKILVVIVTVLATVIVLFSLFFFWLLIKNPFNVRGLMLYRLGWTDEPVKIMPKQDSSSSSTFRESVTSGASGESLIVDKKPALIPMTQEQRTAVENFGIDPDSLILTSETEKCFVEKIGQKRVDEIKTGDTPGPIELIRASSCL